MTTTMETMTTMASAMVNSTMEMMNSTVMDGNMTTQEMMNNTTMMMMNTTKAPMTSMEMAVKDFHYVMSAVIAPILCFLGMIGNILSIIVWYRPNMRSSTGRYLIGQAVADFGVLLSFILIDSVTYWAPSITCSYHYGVFFSYVGYPMLFFTVVCSIWYTVGVTVDRYIMVCWITKAKTFCSESRANIGLVLITVNCFIINIPHYLSFEPMHTDRSEGCTNPSFQLTEFGGGAGGMFYEFWIHCIILVLIPWFTVLTLNMVIIRKITASNKRMSTKKNRESIKKSKQSENQITRLLLVVTFTFLVFIGMQCIIQCLWMQKPTSANMTMVSGAWAFGKTGILFNSSFNFLLYCLSGRRFRSELLKMLGIQKADLVHISSSSMHKHTGSSGGTSSTRSTSNTDI